MTPADFPRILLHDYGGYAFTYQAAQMLAARGYPIAYLYSKTTQFITRNPGADSPNLINHGIQLSQPFQKYSFLKRRAQEMEHGRRVAEQVAQIKPDIVISANTPLDAQQIIFRTARQNHARFVYWLQDAIGLATARVLSARYPVLGALIGRYYTALERSMARRSDRMILISEDFRALVDAWGVLPQRVHVIPNWAPLEEISPRPKDNPWACRHALQNKFCFVYSGILGLKHNPALFVRLAQELAKIPSARVVVIAEGPGAEWLKGLKGALNLENLLVLDYQPYNDFPDVLGAADVLVAILGEDAGQYSVPSKVLSYLCANRPLLLAVPPHNLAARIVRDNCAGVVVPPGDAAGFARAALEFCNNPEMKGEMAANGRRYALENFDITRIMDRFERVIR